MIETIDARAVSADVCVIGMGYIGLPTAVFFASAGLSVVGFDVDQEKISSISKGELPFWEPGLEELLQQALDSGALRASAQIEPARAYIITVPTPVTPESKVDDSYIRAAAQSVAGVLRGGELVVLESTSPPGMTEQLGQQLLSMRSDLTLSPNTSESIYLAHCPERVLPGRIAQEMAENDRIIGGVNPEAGQRARDLYSTFATGSIHLTDAKTAELTKITENTFRDVNIAFANELSLICDHLNVDVWELIELANRHPRVNILRPGPGVGGHCIAVDPWFLVSAAPEQANLVRAARAVNDGKPLHVVSSVAELIAEHDVRSVAVLGLAFKADVDDLRESPSLAIAEKLAAENHATAFNIVEPHIQKLPPSLEILDNARLVPLESAIESSQAVVLLVDHAEFCSLKPQDLTRKHVIDTRGIWR